MQRKWTLQELRRARKRSQERVAKELRIGQEGVSQIEKRADLMISTLRKTVEAMGGSLALVAQFPDSEPVILSGIADDKPEKPMGRKRAHGAHENLCAKSEFFGGSLGFQEKALSSTVFLVVSGR